MAISLASTSVSISPSLATFNTSSSHTKNETADGAVNIGNLDQESAIVTVSDKGTVAGASVTTTFTAQEGYTSLSESYNNIVDQLTTVFQLMDNTGAVIASNALDATPEQKAAFTKWQKGTLTLVAGTYTATATAGNGAGLSIQKSERQGTSLQVSSTLTGSDPSEYYNFSLSGSNIKLDFRQLTSGANAARIVLYDKNGAVVADSQGNTFQRSKYVELTSGLGLSAKSGDYKLKVTYAKNVNATKDIKYDLQLYSGNSYAVLYKNKVAAKPYDGTAAGSVTATDDAELYEHTSYNKINATAMKAVNIGWLQKDKSMLDVASMLTGADHTDYYTFVLQQGDNLKFGFNKNTKDTSKLRVQLMNSTGTQVIADNFGTPAQRKAYEKLTTTNGMDTKASTYVIKITFAQGAARRDMRYEFGVYSGTTFAAQYKTTATPQTIANAMLRGEMAHNTTNGAAMAAYLKAMSNSTDDNDLTANSLSNALKSFI